MTPSFRNMDFWSRVALVLCLGYGAAGRSFAYLGIPPLKLFIGEMALGAFLLFKGNYVCKQWYANLTKNFPFTGLAWCMLLGLFYGIFEFVRGLHLGYSPLTAAQNLVFNVYPLYIFLGIWTGVRYPNVMLKIVRFLSWFVCIYGPLYLLFLHNLTWMMPGSDTPVFSQVGGSFTLIGLFCLEPNIARYWLPLTGSAFMMLATQVRSEWLGFGLMLFIWGFLGKKMGKVMLTGAIVVALLAIGFVSDFRLPSTKERGGEVSSREIVARALSAVDQDLAEEYSSAKNVRFYAGTIYWRTRWWHAIWDESNRDTTSQLIGQGYGFPLSRLVRELQGKDIRTPHNIFFFCLSYTGWIGVVLFFSMQLCIFHLLWRSFKRTGQPLGICLWASTIVAAFFGNLFESFGAIASYLLVGILIAPGLHRARIRRPMYFQGEVAREPVRASHSPALGPVEVTAQR